MTPGAVTPERLLLRSRSGRPHGRAVASEFTRNRPTGAWSFETTALWRLRWRALALAWRGRVVPRPAGYESGLEP